MAELNKYGNQAVKCNGCNILYCTPHVDIDKCEQCGSKNIEKVDDQDAIKIMKDVFRKSM